MAEIFRIDGWREGVDVPADARIGEREEQRLAASGRDGMIDGVIGVGWSDFAGTDSTQSIRTADALKVQVREVARRCRAEGLETGDVIAIRKSYTSEGAPEGVRNENSRTITVLYIVEQVLRSDLVEQGKQVLARQGGSFAALVVIEPVHVEGEAGLDGLVE